MVPDKTGLLLLAFVCGFVFHVQAKDSTITLVEKIFNSPPGAVDPSGGGARLPSYGVSLLELACTPLTEGETGHPVFQFNVTDGTDKVWYRFQGVNLMAVTSGEKTIKTERSSSFVGLAKKTKLSVSTKIGVEIMGEGSGNVGAGFESSSEHSSKTSSNFTWELQSLSQIDNTFSVLSGEEHPKLAPEFEQMLKDHCFQPIKANRQRNQSAEVR